MVANDPSYQSNLTNAHVVYANSFPKGWTNSFTTAEPQHVIAERCQRGPKKPNFQIDDTYTIN